MQPGAEIKISLEESILIFEVVVNGEVFGNESQLGLGDLSLVGVVEAELELGEAVKQLAGEFVEEEVGVAVELGGHAEGRSFREGKEN